MPNAKGQWNWVILSENIKDYTITSFSMAYTHFIEKKYYYYRFRHEKISQII